MNGSTGFELLSVNKMLSKAIIIVVLTIHWNVDITAAQYPVYGRYPAYNVIGDTGGIGVFLIGGAGRPIVIGGKLTFPDLSKIITAGGDAVDKILANTPIGALRQYVPPDLVHQIIGYKPSKNNYPPITIPNQPQAPLLPYPYQQPQAPPFYAGAPVNPIDQLIYQQQQQQAYIAQNNLVSGLERYRDYLHNNPQVNEQPKPQYS